MYSLREHSKSQSPFKHDFGLPSLSKKSAYLCYFIIFSFFLLLLLLTNATLFLVLTVPHGMQDSSLTRDLNPCSLHWEHRVLTTRLPGKSPRALLFDPTSLHMTWPAYNLCMMLPAPHSQSRLSMGSGGYLLHDTDTTTSTRLEVSLWWAGKESWSHALFSRINAHRLPSC